MCGIGFKGRGRNGKVGRNEEGVPVVGNCEWLNRL